MISYRLKQDIVADTVREWIMEGKYRPGDQLPTDSDLSEMFQMNRRTIGIGLNQLVSENILERAPRRGTVVKKSLENEENVYLRGFGSFIVKKRAQKTARNISKNTTIIIPEHNIPAFKPAKTFTLSVKK